MHNIAPLVFAYVKRNGAAHLVTKCSSLLSLFVFYPHFREMFDILKKNDESENFPEPSVS